VSAASDAARARCGWQSDFPTFADEEPRVVRISLQGFLAGASESQVFAWDESIPQIQVEVGEVVDIDRLADQYTAILEYELPLESRRPDVVLLVSGAVVVLELKSKTEPDQADLDQASAYARDLRCYHRHCAGREVHAVVVPTRAHGYTAVRDGVHIASPDTIHDLIQSLQRPWSGGHLKAEDFLSSDAYCPLPTLVQAARELFKDGKVRNIPEARADTDPAVDELSRIAHEAARTKSRHLVLVTGVPGSGKTLVGLRAVHSPKLADIAVERAGGSPTAPAIFLSGNGPLVEVLQYELKDAGGEGKTFVRDVKNYVKQYLGNSGAIPPHHVIVYDEAQRAWDAEQVSAKHAFPSVVSEPEAFVEFGERVPEWCVLVGLIGAGQEIHIGEEGGLGQWREALEKASVPGAWTVHAPAAVLAAEFQSLSGGVQKLACEALELTRELRFHFAADLDEWVERFLEERDPSRCGDLAARLEQQSYHLRMTRDFDAAADYLRDRYGENCDARFGLVASSRDKALVDWGVRNDYWSVERVRRGPWYADGEESPRSCRHLRDCLSEFKTQGLELDGVLLAWGTDLERVDGQWSIGRAKGYRGGTPVKDPYQLRLNAYRVLLTRGRDCTVLYVPPIRELDETSAWIQECGVRPLV
jgi:hypothetical protein